MLTFYLSFKKVFDNLFAFSLAGLQIVYATKVALKIKSNLLIFIFFLVKKLTPLNDNSLKQGILNDNA